MVKKKGGGASIVPTRRVVVPRRQRISASVLPYASVSSKKNRRTLRTQLMNSRAILLVGKGR